MKSNARCWTPPAAAPLIGMLWLSGCTMGSSDVPAACPPVVAYTTADLARAADEVEALPESALVVQMLSDYAVLRDQARACRWKSGRTSARREAPDASTAATCPARFTDSQFQGAAGIRCEPMMPCAAMVCRALKWAQLCSLLCAHPRCEALTVLLTQLVEAKSSVRSSGHSWVAQHDHLIPADLCRDVCAVATHVRDVEGSKAITDNPHPKVIVSASGMATGVRVLHHIRTFAPEWRSLILFSGFQAAGTLGKSMLDGATEVKMFGEWVPVRAEIANLPMLSAHADANELLL